MDLLFVHEGDSKAEGKILDMGQAEHAQFMAIARAEYGGNPLIRRLNNFYGDVLFEFDELAGLHEELKNLAVSHQTVELLKAFVVSAIDGQIGIETIAD